MAGGRDPAGRERRRQDNAYRARSLAASCMNKRMSIELAIRARRAAFNRAIAEGDAAAIGPLLTRDCVMITGTDSAVIAGRVAQVKVWRREFSAADRLIYVRTPSLITPSPVEPIAMEQGEWRGSARQADGEASE